MRKITTNSNEIGTKCDLAPVRFTFFMPQIHIFKIFGYSIFCFGRIHPDLPGAQTHCAGIGGKFNLVLSDAMHNERALVEEMEQLIKYELVDLGRNSIQS